MKPCTTILISEVMCIIGREGGKQNTSASFLDGRDKSGMVCSPSESFGLRLSFEPANLMQYH